MGTERGSENPVMRALIAISRFLFAMVFETLGFVWRLCRKLTFIYLAYLIIFKCPLTQDLPEDACWGCVTVHQGWEVVGNTYDRYAAPALEPYFEKYEPQIAKVRPVAIKVRDGSMVAAKKVYVWGEPRVSALAVVAQRKAQAVLEKPAVQERVRAVHRRFNPYLSRAIELYDTRLEPLLTEAKDYATQGLELSKAHIIPVVRHQAANAWSVSRPFIYRAGSLIHKYFIRGKSYAAAKLSKVITKRVTDADEPRFSVFPITEESVPGSEYFASATDSGSPTATSITEQEPPISAPLSSPGYGSISSSSSATAWSADLESASSKKPSTSESRIASKTTVSEQLSTPSLELSANQASQDDAEETSETVIVYSTKTMTVNSGFSEATKPRIPQPASVKKTNWKKRVDRTVKSAISNLQDLVDLELVRLTADAKPDFMKLLRDISTYGEMVVLQMTQQASEIEASDARVENEDEIYKGFQVAVETLQEKATEVRTRAQRLASEAVDIVDKIRAESMDPIDDFFDNVLAEANREIIALVEFHDSNPESDFDEWTLWKDYNELKTHLTKSRGAVEEYVVDMGKVNVALRESQDAANLLGQDFTTQITTLRAQTQFLIQMRSPPPPPPQNAKKPVKEEEEIVQKGAANADENPRDETLDNSEADILDSSDTSSATSITGSELDNEPILEAAEEILEKVAEKLKPRDEAQSHSSSPSVSETQLSLNTFGASTVPAGETAADDFILIEGSSILPPPSSTNTDQQASTETAARNSESIGGAKTSTEAEEPEPKEAEIDTHESVNAQVLVPNSDDTEDEERISSQAGAEAKRSSEAEAKQSFEAQA